MSFVRNSLPGIVTLLMVVAFGLFGGLLATRVGLLTVPSAIGLPYGLPGLRVVPLGETGWLTLLTESGCALVLVAVVWRARRGFFGTWGAFLLGSVLVGVLRAVVLSQVAGAGLGAYAGFVVGGLVAGLLWGIALGWVVGLASLARRTAPRFAASPTA